MLPKIDEVMALHHKNEGWKVLVKDDKAQIYIDSFKTHRGNMMMKAQGPVAASPIDVWRCINYGSNRIAFDDTCDICRNMSKEGVNAYTVYNRSK